jgi:hypothetical protein
MTPEDFKNLSSSEQANFYRCPACGEMVDKRRVDEIVLHHSHVLRPHDFPKSIAGVVRPG